MKRKSRNVAYNKNLSAIVKKVVRNHLYILYLKDKMERQGMVVAKHKKGTDNQTPPDSCNGSWLVYWEQKLNISIRGKKYRCPSCDKITTNIVGAHIEVNGRTYIYPTCRSCNSKYKQTNEINCCFFVRNDLLVRAPQD